MSAPFVKSRFDSSGQPQAPYTATLSTVLRAALRAHARGLRVCLPARIEALHGSFSADVRPGFLEVHGQSSEPTAMPLLPNVPISMPHGANYSIRLPVAVGDTGYVLVADRSIDAWLAGDGSPARPGDARTHDLTDAIFVPGLLTISDAASAANTSSDMVLTAGRAAIRMEQAGKLAIGNGVVELLEQVRSLAMQVSTLAAFVAGATVPPGGGPLVFPANPGAAGAAVTGANAVAQNMATIESI